MTSELAGIFVGGRGTRMGHVAKGLMRTADGMSIVERWRMMLERLGIRVVLVGVADAYVGLGIEALPDEPHGIGPLGGLVALLRSATEGVVLALACDMPFVSSAIVERLIAAPSGAVIVAPRSDGRWEPLCARYDVARVLPMARALSRNTDHSLQRLLDDAGAIELPLAPHEVNELRDWDTPGDVTSSRLAHDQPD
ncbi:MAG: molybdenum cofactor guanylyltransferase [Myxococcota bacterium]|nr:molybdenum cofactor guanylyltransferase [Myxococcota bacterium]